MTPTIWLASAGFVATAVSLGPARMGFGLFLPTFRGVDARGRNEIHRIMADLAGRGVAIVLITSELEELVLLSDRVLVMRDGAIAGALQGTEITEAAVVGLAAGSGPVPHDGREPAAIQLKQ